MGTQTERRRYYPEEENVPLSVVISEMVREHDELGDDAEEGVLYDHVDPDALNRLVTDSASDHFVLQCHLSSATLTVWRDGGIDIRVTATDE